MTLPKELVEALERASGAGTLLVASDFDGTLSEIVDDPSSARLDAGCAAALGRLAGSVGTPVAVVSGRALADLRRLTAAVPGLRLVGSHGSEWDASFAAELPGALRARKETIERELRAIAARTPGVFLEDKPAGVALHYRHASPVDGERAVAECLAGPGRLEGVFIRHGKKVLEVAALPASKGAALERLRRESGAAACVFVGDDETDEDAFNALTPGDVGVKVGPEPSAAGWRVGGVAEVASLLQLLADLRGREAGAERTPIDHHAMLSDQRTAALTDDRGRVVWLCVPRLDSPPIFAEILGSGDGAAGLFEVRPAEASGPPARRYLADSFVLQTRWESLQVTDYMDCSEGRAFQRAGRTDLLRVLERAPGARPGPVRAMIRFAPRLDFGRVVTRLNPREGGLEIEGGADPLALVSPGVTWRIVEDGQHQTALGEATVGDEPIVLELRAGMGSLRPSPTAEAARREAVQRFWSGWAGTLRLPTLARERVRRSALVLKALTFGPTGAVAAAATTSLPERIGGVRNWDYRYCWPRDAAMAASALVRLGSTGTALKLLDWLTQVVEREEAPDRLRPIYTVAGSRLGPEGEVGHLPGYAGSRPVRVGNAASEQTQLDVFGPIVELAAALASRGAPLSPDHWRLVQAMAAAAAQRWSEPDHGIWEERTARRHHVHSKVMAWSTLTRAADLSDAMLGRDRPDWRETAAAIRDDVLTHGWSESLRSFKATYDAEELDAASLSVGLSGMLAPDDPRVAGTVAAIQGALRDGPTVRRYTRDDGLPGREGGFHLCTGWLIEALWMSGRRDDARELFDGFCGLIGPLGLLSEEWEPEGGGTALGNYPQAYSHLALINAAVALDAGA